MQKDASRLLQAGQSSITISLITSLLPITFPCRRNHDRETDTLATSATTAGLNIPHGVAPTAPVNGDFWTTTAGIYSRINGVTIGPLTNASGTAFVQNGNSYAGLATLGTNDNNALAFKTNNIEKMRIATTEMLPSDRPLLMPPI